MDVIELLEQDHSAVNELFRRYQLASKAETKATLVKEIVHDLSVHAAVEEQFVYPLLRLRVSEGRTIANRSIAEHGEAKKLLAEIEDCDAGSDEQAALVDRLIDAIREHVEEEESEVFPALREQTNEALRANLGKLVAAAKHAVPTHPHPLVPGTATAQLAAGPWLTFIDKTRDLFASR